MWFFVLAFFVLWALKRLFVETLFPPKRLELSKLGRWAVVTGATDGIGKAFAEELAAAGLDVVLISRNIRRLESVAQELVDKYSVSTKVVQADFATNDDKMYDLIRKSVDSLDVAVLVNNVGKMYAHPEYFHKLDEHQSYVCEGIINCNVTATVRMVELILPGMLSRKRGLIVNVSSGLSEVPMPFVSLYTGTKAFVAKFSRDLNLEYQNQGVKVHLLKTGMVATKMLRVRRATWKCPLPTTYVRSALKEATLTNSSESTGFFSHTLIHNAVMAVNYLRPDYCTRKLYDLSFNVMERQKERCKHCNPPEKGV